MIEKLLEISRLAVLLVVVAAAGCDQHALLDKFSDPENTAKAQNYIRLIRDREFDAVERDIDPSLVNSQLRPTLEGMANLIPAGEPTSVKLVGVQTFKAPSESSVNTTLEYGYGKKWYLANIAIKTKDGTKTITGFHWYVIPASLEQQNKFSLEGKSKFQYGILILAISLPLFTLFVLIKCIKAKNVHRKWLWVLFIMFGFGSVYVNWTTGQIGFVLPTLYFFSAAFTQQLYGPVLISVSLPVGAIVFLIRQWRSSRTVVAAFD